MSMMKTTRVAIVLGVCAFLWPSSSATVAETFDIEGCVVDCSGRAVSGAVVIAYHECECEPLGRHTSKPVARTTTGPEGKFAIEGELDTWISEHKLWVVAHKKPLALAWTLTGLKSHAIVQLGKPQPLGGIVADHMGRPVVGASVRLCLKNEPMAGHPYRTPELFLPGDEPWHVAETDGAGRFLFNNIPLDTTADFRIDAPGRAPIWTFSDSALTEAEQFPVGRTDIKITLPAPTRIEGQVVDEETGTPVTGAAVLARPHERSGENYYNDPVPVDPNGCFSVRDLSPGAYVLQVAAFGNQEQEWFGHSPVYTIEEGVSLRGVPLKVNKGAILEIVARDPKLDAKVVDMHVKASSDLYTRHTVTDANGYASLCLPAGKYHLTGVKHGRGVSISGPGVSLQKGQTHQEELRFDLWIVKFSGTIVDANGRPQPGASIRFWPFANSGVTDANGFFEGDYYTEGRASQHLIGVRHEASGTAGLSMVTDSGGDGHLTGQIMLEPAHAITGRVVDSNGKALAGARVDLFLAGDDRWPSRIGEPLATRITDANGTYRIPALSKLRPGSDPYCAVAARLPGYNGNSVGPVPLDGPVDEVIHLDPIILERADRVVSGIVVDTDGNPVPGILVGSRSVYQEDAKQPHRQTLTDGGGRFCLEGLCTGQIEVGCWAPALEPSRGYTNTVGGDRHVKIVLGQTLDFAKYLIGSPLPDWRTLGVAGLPDGIEDKAVLLCLFDIQQRPSRHFLSQLGNWVQRLHRRRIAVVAVPMSDVRFDYNIGLSMAYRESDASELRLILGVQSLPWMILTDRNRTVVAEGFTLADLESQLDKVR